MKSFNVQNVSEAIVVVGGALREHGSISESRNGPVLSFDCPISVTYRKPQQKVLYHPARLDNPFMNFFDALFMFTAETSPDFLMQFAPSFDQFANNGVLRGDYGFRMLAYFGYDQLEYVLKQLQKNKYDRRQLIQLHDRSRRSHDLNQSSNDVCCNLMIIPRVRPNRYKQDVLDITVVNRSNDLMWGMFGANAVQFATLQEYMAARLGVGVGEYTQVSTNAHAYMDFGPWRNFAEHLKSDKLVYGDLYPEPYDFGQDISQDDFLDFKTDLQVFFNEWRDIGEIIATHFETNWFQNVVKPMYLAHHNIKEENYDDARHYINRISAPDWAEAAARFVQRRSPV